MINHSDESADERQVTFSLGRYNRSRGVQHDLVKTMSTMMKRNLCLSASYPLLAAVDGSWLDVNTVSKDYDPSHSTKDALQQAIFHGCGEIVVLNGRQRVIAAKQSFRFISEKAGKLRAHIVDLEQEANQFEDQVMTPAERRLRTKMDQAKDDLGHLEKTLHNIQFWPVHFYDQGSIASLSEDAATDPYTGKLRSIPGKARDFPGDRNNQDCLLHFLSENVQELSQPKGPDEKLADILFRNLYGPQPIASWSHLISENRILENACLRPNLWEMANNLMLVSPSLLGTRVASASALYAHAHNDTLGVSYSLHAAKR